MERAYPGTVDEHLGGNSDGAVEIASSPSSASCQRRGSALDVARRQEIEQRTPQQRELLGALSQPLGGVTNLRRLRLEKTPQRSFGHDVVGQHWARSLR